MPIDRNAIDTQLKEIGEGERWWEHSEFRALPRILHEGERILGIARGKLIVAGLMRLRPAGRWLFVVTSQRLLCLKQERFARKQLEFAAGQIDRIQQGARLRVYQIALETAQGRYRIRIAKEDAFGFAGSLARLMPNPPARIHDAELETRLLPGVGARGGKKALPSEYATRAHVDRLEATVDRLQTDVDRLQQQVVFLENLLHQRADTALR